MEAEGVVRWRTPSGWPSPCASWSRTATKRQALRRCHLEALAPVVSRYGGAADAVFTPTSIHAEGVDTPSVVNLVHYDSAAAYERFTADPDYLAIKPLRDESTRMLSFEGQLIAGERADDHACGRLYGIEIVGYRDGSPDAYERYASEADRAMRPYGHRVDSTMYVASHPEDRAADVVRITSFLDERERARFTG